MTSNGSSKKSIINTRKDKEIWDALNDYDKVAVEANCWRLSLSHQHHLSYSSHCEYHSFFAFMKENLETRFWSMPMALNIMLTIF